MTWSRLRWILIGIGAAMFLAGTLPIWLLVAAFNLGGFLGGVVFVVALLLSPLLIFLRLGLMVIGATWRGQQVVVMGRKWGPAVASEPDVIDAEFETR